jgi:hypothetical protein
LFVLIAWLACITLLLLSIVVCVIVIWNRQKKTMINHQSLSVAAQKPSTPHNAPVTQASSTAEQNQASGNAKPVAAVPSGNTTNGQGIVESSGGTSRRVGDAEVAKLEASKQLLREESYIHFNNETTEMAKVAE